jgi:tetratricopeptide (TPR) repeat protein
MRLRARSAFCLVLAAMGGSILTPTVFPSLVANGAALVVARIALPGAQGRVPVCWPCTTIASRWANGKHWEWEGRRALAGQDFEAAAFLFEQALQYDPDQALLHCLLGDAYDGAGRRVDARAEWVRAGAFSRLLEAGQEAAQTGRWDDGVAALSAAWDLCPADWRVVTAWIGLYRAKSDAEGMAAVLHHVIAVAPDNPFSQEWRLQLGDILEKQGRWVDAIGVYRDAVSQAPTDAHALVRLGQALYQGGHRAEALLEIDQALALAPDLPDAYLAKRLIYRAEGQYAEALAMAQRAAELDPTSPWPLAAQAEGLMDVGQVSAAISLLGKVIESHPEEAHLYYLLAYAYRGNGEMEKAVVAAEQAAVVNGPNGLAYRLTVARMREEGGDVSGAIKTYLSILALAPANQEARQALFRLQDRQETR